MNPEPAFHSNVCEEIIACKISYISLFKYLPPLLLATGISKVLCLSQLDLNSSILMIVVKLKKIISKKKSYLEIQGIKLGCYSLNLNNMDLNFYINVEMIFSGIQILNWF